MILLRTLSHKARTLSGWAARTFLRPDSIVILDRQPLRPREDHTA